ncbi:MAG: hypothetical protein AB1635_11375 [Acidobacteriota bacterium]
MEREEFHQAANVEHQQHLVVFLPFLRLKEPCAVAGVEFLPLRTDSGEVPEVLAATAGPLGKILSGYVDRHGAPLGNCVVATILGKGWDLEPEDFPAVAWATSLLFLASWACNDYYSQFAGRYVNSTNFRIVGQKYRGSDPKYISVSARRRFGSSTDGGYEHGEFKFTLPVQVSVRETASVDAGLLAGLDVAQGSGSAVLERLRTALPFVELANTDDEFMTEHAEAILMGSAFEQLLAGNASAYALGRRFGELFQQFGSVTVDHARKARPGIEIDTCTAQRAAAQPHWWVHRKWMEELYDVRSKVVHKGHAGSRQWGWQIAEHLVMAAHVFPLTVKLLLEQEGYYAVTERDRAACLATDLLLVETEWAEDLDAQSNGRSWQEVIRKTARDVRFNAVWENYKARHPGLFQSRDADEPAADE